MKTVTSTYLSDVLQPLVQAYKMPLTISELQTAYEQFMQISILFTKLFFPLLFGHVIICLKKIKCVLQSLTSNTGWNIVDRAVKLTEGANLSERQNKKKKQKKKQKKQKNNNKKKHKKTTTTTSKQHKKKQKKKQKKKNNNNNKKQQQQTNKQTTTTTKNIVMQVAIIE